MSFERSYQCCWWCFSASKINVYDTASQKAGDIVSKTKNLRTTLGKLFNRPKVATTPDDNDDTHDFLPGPSFRQPARKRKGKGKYPAKGAIKRKVKEYRLKIIGLKEIASCTPIGAERESLLKNVWIRETASAEEVQRKICEEFHWSRYWNVEYMYASGRYLRPATLKDVENSDSWDAPTVRALMGSGCLYVSRIPTEKSVDKPDSGGSDTETEVLYYSALSVSLH